MSDYQKDHTPKQLLDRIIRIERECDRLKETIRVQSATISELRKDLKAEAADATKHFNIVYDRFVDFDQTYAPVLYKVFPHLAVERIKTKKLLDELRLPNKK